jgi:hypothetical protein
MSTLSGGPNTVTNGLVLSLDAANTKSYVSGSTTWTDLSRSNNNGILTNGPTFNTGSLGSIVFDGVDDYGNIGPASKYLTAYHAYELWIKTSGIGLNTQSGLLGISYGLTINLQSNGSLTYLVYSNEASAYIINSVTTGLNLLDDKWHHIVCTRGVSAYGIYIDGVLNSSGSPGSWTGTNIWAAMNALIGNNPNNVNLLYVGTMAIVKVYNRALSTQEVLQNYNATKTRFGL